MLVTKQAKKKKNNFRAEMDLEGHLVVVLQDSEGGGECLRGSSGMI